jgi:hypothetical protein
MADDLPHYRAWLLTRPCRCAPCVAAVEVHHPRHSPTYAPDAKPEKALGGKPGKGQRASDYYGIPICYRDHRNLHALKGFFQGWSGEQLRAWQDEQIEQLHAEYEAYLERNPHLAPEASREGHRGVKKPGPRAANDAVTKAVLAERNAIITALQRLAGEARHKPGEHQVLCDAIEIIEARGRA